MRYKIEDLHNGRNWPLTTSGFYSAKGLDLADFSHRFQRSK